MAKKTTRKTTATTAAASDGDGELLRIIIAASGKGKADAQRAIAALSNADQAKIRQLAKKPNSGAAICQLLVTSPSPTQK